MAWKPVAPRTQQQQLAKVAAGSQSPPKPPITNDDIERMIDQIPEALAPGLPNMAVDTDTGAVYAGTMPADTDMGKVTVKDLTKLATAIPSDDEIANLIAKLSPTQIAKARLQMGIPAGGGLKRLPGGGVEVTIKISADTVPVLQSWAEAAGIGLEEQIQQIAEQSITNYCFQDWGSLQAPAPVAAAAVTPTSVAATTPPPAATGK